MARTTSIQILNVRGLANNFEPRIIRRGKLEFLKENLTQQNSLFIGLTETWLNQDHNDAEICPDGYELIRQDREGRECGGVALLVRDDFTAEPLLRFSNDGCEVLVVKILQLNHHGLTMLLRHILCLFYLVLIVHNLQDRFRRRYDLG